MSTHQTGSSYAMGSIANMARSLLVVGALVALLVAIVPRVNSISQPPVDVEAAASNVARQSGLSVSRPVGLPEGWKATSVRYVRSTDGVMTWHIGYQTPDGGYVALEQAKDATESWIAAQTNRARQNGTVQAAGRTWQAYDPTAKDQRSILSRAGTPEELTTLVTGKGSIEEFTVFAEALEPVTAG